MGHGPRQQFRTTVGAGMDGPGEIDMHVIFGHFFERTKDSRCGHFERTKDSRMIDLMGASVFGVFLFSIVFYARKLT